VATSTVWTVTGLPGSILLECFLELLTPGQAAYGQLVRFKQPRNALESNRIALERKMDNDSSILAAIRHTMTLPESFF